MKIEYVFLALVLFNIVWDYIYLRRLKKLPQKTEAEYLKVFEKALDHAISRMSLYNTRTYFLHTCDWTYARNHRTDLAGLSFLIPEIVLKNPAKIDAALYFTSYEMEILREGAKVFEADKRTAELVKDFLLY